MHADWDQLLQQSESLAARDTQGFPRVDRDISQVEAFSSNLKAKSQRLDTHADALAATRLLAQEGFNSRALDRALQAVELRPTYEDLFQAETGSVEEYLEQMHEMTVVTAIQEAQKDSIAAFDKYMARCMDEEWAEGKRQLFESTLGDRARSHALALPSSTPGHSLAVVQPPDAAGGQGHTLQLSGREKEYTQVVNSLNEANLSKQRFDAVAAFAAAASRDPSEEHRSTIGQLWQLLEAIVCQEPEPVGGAKARVAAMVKGARRSLEEGHVKHMNKTIQTNRAQAHLGGTPSRKGQVQAYLRLREHDQGPLDFDTPGGVDTTWHRIYLCLRSAFYPEAIEIARRAKDAPLLSGATFARLLDEWVQKDGQLSPESNAAVVEECERQKASADRAAWQRVSFRYKFAVHALLAGERRIADTLLREGGGVFGVIEDFMWFTTSLVRSAPSTSQASSSGLRGALAGGRLGEPYKLSHLQNYMVQFPPTHYSQGGKEPLMYATVLLLSLQFKALVGFLAKDSSSRAYRVDAPHIAIALLHHQATGLGGEGDAGAKQGVQPGKVIHHYAQQFAGNAPEIALEYYMLAALALGNDKQTKASLLRELLTESNAFGYLLGSGGSHGGALERWMGSKQERQELLEAVAYHCQRAAQLDWASELFLYAGNPRPALHLLNLQISDLLEPTLPSSEEELESLMRRGSEAVNMMASSSASEDEAEKTAFDQLKTIQRMLTAKRQGDNARAVQLLADLDFVPTEGYRLQRCTDAVPSLHPALLQRLSSLCLMAAHSLAATSQVAQLRTLLTFAGNLPQRISLGTLRELSDIYNIVS